MAGRDVMRLMRGEYVIVWMSSLPSDQSVEPAFEPTNPTLRRHLTGAQRISFEIA
jgi:hypothetical protein